MDDLAKLERDEGFDFVIKGNTYNFRGSLALLPADNLASQFIGGYKALNSALRKCRHCMATGETMSHKFQACLFQPRTRSTHREHCSLLQTEYADHIATTYGLTRDSILNTSRYFHVTEGLPPDCMHDILEGTLQYEIKELLKFITSQRILSLEEINNRIQLFPYGSCDVASKPSPLTLSSDGHSLKQSASQMWCLARLLPLIIGEKIPECDEHWDNFLLLLKIAEYVFSPVSSHEIAAYLTTLIEDYLQTFTELYPNCPIIPKQHYMLHIPEWIVRCGPMTKYWCMRFEAKNSRFKDIANKIKNFKNIAKSLATRHQSWSCYVNTAHTQNNLITGPVNTVVVEELPFASQLCTTLTITKDETIQRCSWVQIYGTKYKPKDIVALSNEFLPNFGKILSIIFINVDKCYFVCELLHTSCFHPHYNAYEVSIEASPKIVICTQNELADHHILCLYNIGDYIFVPLKYFLPQCF